MVFIGSPTTPKRIISAQVRVRFPHKAHCIPILLMIMISSSFAAAPNVSNIANHHPSILIWWFVSAGNWEVLMTGWPDDLGVYLNWSQTQSIQMPLRAYIAMYPIPILPSFIGKCWWPMRWQKKKSQHLCCHPTFAWAFTETSAARFLAYAFLATIFEYKQ